MLRYPKADSESKHGALGQPIQSGRGVFLDGCGGAGSGGEGADVADGADVLLLSLGGMLTAAREVGLELRSRGISCDVYNLRFIKPLDRAYLSEIVSKYSLAVVVEEGVVRGGIGELIAAGVREYGVGTPIQTLGVPDSFIEHGTRAELLRLCGLDSPSILRTVEQALERSPSLRIYRAT
jgi:1-deoxy-D-xylulose-5-phosphate synthase